MSSAIKSKQSPAERRHLRVRGVILKAAEHMFARDGEAALSIRKLAKGIDYSPGAIYKYFESKQDLVDALKEAFFEVLLARLEVFDGRAEDYPAYAHGFLNIYVQAALEKPHHYTAAFMGICDPDAPLLPSVEGSLKVQAFAKLRDMVQTGVELGVFQQSLDVMQTAKSIWASLHGAVALILHLPHFHAIMMDDAPSSQTDFISRHISFILQGISK